MRINAEFLKPRVHALVMRVLIERYEGIIRDHKEFRALLFTNAQPAFRAMSLASPVKW
jgi:hypothetical protein